jgi:hypothetical protein
MKMSLKFLLLCFLMLPVQSEAFASPNVTIVPMSDNVYAIQCGDFSDIRTVDITIQYDAAALTAPRVVQGGLAADTTIAVTDSKQGVLRFTLDHKAPTWLRRWTRPLSGQSAINGSGTLAIVTFVRTMSTGADILSLAASAVSGTDQGITVASQVVNTGKTADSGAATEQQGGRTAAQPAPWGKEKAHDTTPAATVANASAITATLQVGGAGMAGPSGGHFPSDDGEGVTPLLNQPAVEIRQPDNDATSSPIITKTESNNNPVPKTSEQKKTMLYQSVLERFRGYKGEETPEALMALFSAGGEGEGRQDPPLVLSDGKTTLNVVVELNGKDNNFYLDGASLVSLKNKEKNYWIVELLPKKNALTATIIIPRNDQQHVTPLTVAPPWDVTVYQSSGKSAEADFRRYLKERGTAKSPRFDLNGDGRRDYIDDYIFTANFIVKCDSKAKAPTPH